jgi:hypothetical protein
MRKLPTIPVYNVHRRRLQADADTVGALLDGVGARGDRLWPVQNSIPIRIDRPLQIGARGHHGPASYRVVGYQPQRWLRMEFSHPRCIRGFHEFSVEPHRDSDVSLQHLLAVRLTPLGWLVYPLGLKSLHDQVIEMLLDRAEIATVGATRNEPVRVSWLVRARVLAMRRYLRLKQR